MDRHGDTLQLAFKKSIWSVLGIPKKLQLSQEKLGVPYLTSEQKMFWESHGYLILKGLFQVDQLNAVNHLIDTLWHGRSVPNNPIVADIYTGTLRAQRLFFRDAPENARKTPYKINDLYLECSEIRDLALDSTLSTVIWELLDGAPMIIDTLNMEHGSEQFLHIDTFFMPPCVPNKMLASWIALEDCTQEAGPLIFYPGSHKIPPYYFSDGRLNAIESEMPQFKEYIHREIQARGLELHHFIGEPGDTLIWHAQLLHGGAPILNPASSRRSLVTHYFRAIDQVPAHKIRTISSGKHWLYKKHHAVV